MTINIDSEYLKNQGYFVHRKVLNKDWLTLLKIGLEKSFEEHRQIQIKNGNDIITGGVALHVVLSDEVYLNFLRHLIEIGWITEIKEKFFNSNFILNSFSALDNLPGQLNFSSIVHRDLRFYTGEIPLMLNMLVMLDDFTENNGPTLLLPASHKIEDKPSDQFFFDNALSITGKAGDVLIFNSNVWHASSLNKSNQSRRALPITFTKSSLKQLLDYPRAIGYDKMNLFDEKLQQLLGYHARVPANLEEWYQPFTNRFYKKEQD